MNAEQLSIFDPVPPQFPRARREDHVGSHDAAAKVEDRGSAKAAAALLLDAVRKNPGLTTAELCRVIGMDTHTAGRRLPELASDKVRAIRKVAFSTAEIPTNNTTRCAVSGVRAFRWWPN